MACFNSYPDIFSISWEKKKKKTVSFSYHSCVSSSFNSFSFSFAFTMCLFGKRCLIFQPSLLRLIILSFWFKLRDMWCFFTWTLRGHCRIINRPNFIITVSWGIERPKDRERDWGKGWWEEQSEHTQHL